MASDGGSGNIRAFIHWDDQTVFAGEEIKCTITFKNIAPEQGSQRSSNRPIGGAGAGERNNRQRAKPNVAGLNQPMTLSTGPSRGHRTTLSLSAPAAFTRRSSGSTQWPQLPPHPPKSGDTRGHSHGRSVSIVSIGSASGTAGDDTQSSPVSRPQRPGRGHGRATSLQIAPRAGLGISGPHTGRSRSTQAFVIETLY